MVVMGGIVGSGIFVTPAIVASWTATRAQMLGAWLVGGAAALVGAFVYADLSRQRPFAGDGRSPEGGAWVVTPALYHGRATRKAERNDCPRRPRPKSTKNACPEVAAADSG